MSWLDGGWGSPDLMVVAAGSGRWWMAFGSHGFFSLSITALFLGLVS